MTGFWSLQPVQINENVREGPVTESKDSSSPQFATLPDSMLWEDIDLDRPSNLHDLHDLLYQNYVEDIESQFRLSYTQEFLLWALKPPNFDPSWIFGIKLGIKLVAFISAIPILLRSNNHAFNCAQVNFLCIDKKYRSKNLAPLMITELVRRANFKNVYQAIFTSGKLFSSPLSTAKYYHRPLNFEKLYELGFAELPFYVSLPVMHERCSIKYADTEIMPMRALGKHGIPDILEQLEKHISSFSVSLIFSQTEAEHWLQTRDGIMYSFVVRSFLIFRRATRMITLVLPRFILCPHKNCKPNRP